MSARRWSGSKAWAAYKAYMDEMCVKGLDDRPSFVNFLEEYIACPSHDDGLCIRCNFSGKVQRVNLYFEEVSET